MLYYFELPSAPVISFSNRQLSCTIASHASCGCFLEIKTYSWIFVTGANTINLGPAKSCWNKSHKITIFITIKDVCMIVVRFTFQWRHPDMQKPVWLHQQQTGLFQETGGKWKRDSWRQENLVEEGKISTIEMPGIRKASIRGLDL